MAPILPKELEIIVQCCWPHLGLTAALILHLQWCFPMVAMSMRLYTNGEREENGQYHGGR